MWEYVKGSEADFEGAPDTAQIIVVDKDTIKYHAKSADLDVEQKITAYDMGSYQGTMSLNFWTCPKGSINDYFLYASGEEAFTIIAERRKVDNLQSRVNDANLQQALTGLRVNYYLAQVKQPQREEQKPYQAECEDIIQALGMTFDEGCLFKALWRNASARLDNGKPGQSAVYDAEKMMHYASRIHKWELSK